MAPTDGGTQHTILVVDDDPDYRYLLALMLVGLGDSTTVLPADSGQAALKALREAHADLVILDLELPDMNGWELFMALRADPATAEVPVIILSSHGTRTDRSFGLQVAQVADYLVKPCLPSQLVRTARAALARAQRLREARQQAEPE
jgi:CheY-like chemotaxis protein